MCACGWPCQGPLHEDQRRVMCDTDCMMLRLLQTYVHILHACAVALMCRGRDRVPEGGFWEALPLPLPLDGLGRSPLSVGLPCALCWARPPSARGPLDLCDACDCDCMFAMLSRLGGTRLKSSSAGPDSLGLPCVSTKSPKAEDGSSLCEGSNEVPTLASDSLSGAWVPCVCEGSAAADTPRPCAS